MKRRGQETSSNDAAKRRLRHLEGLISRYRKQLEKTSDPNTISLFTELISDRLAEYSAILKGF